MKFNFIAEILLGFSLLLFSFTYSKYNQSNYPQCLHYFYAGIFLLAISISIHFRDSLLNKIGLEKDVATITRTVISEFTNEKNQSIKKDAQNLKDLSYYYTTSNKRFFPKSPMKKSLSNSKLKKIRMGGLIMEGPRKNLIPKNWFNDQKKLPIKGVIQNSRIASFPVPEYIFRIGPHKTLNINIKALPLANRNDYTFSFLYYTEGEVFSHIKLQSSISDGNEKVTEKFLYKNEHIYILNKKKGLIVFRPSISHNFSGHPKKIIANIEVENITTKEFIFIFCFPAIEQGLFASSPVRIADFRAGETLFYKGADKMLGSKKGTLSFFFQPYWGSNDLTANISPHLFYSITDDLKNGIRIYSDANDSGKIKVESVNDGSKSYIVSEMSPLEGEVYSVYLRWENNLADLILNGKSIYSANLLMPSANALPTRFYLGSSPISEEHSAYAVLRDFKFYFNWISDRIIKAEIYRSLPEVFPEFESYATELVKAQKKMRQ